MSEERRLQFVLRSSSESRKSFVPFDWTFSASQGRLHSRAPSDTWKFLAVAREPGSLLSAEPLSASCGANVSLFPSGQKNKTKHYLFQNFTQDMKIKSEFYVFPEHSEAILSYLTTRWRTAKPGPHGSSCLLSF